MIAFLFRGILYTSFLYRVAREAPRQIHGLSFAESTPDYIAPCLSAQVKLALGQHPRNRRGCHDQRTQEASLQGSLAENKFTDEVRQRNAVRPHGEIVCDRGVNVVGGGHANHGGEESPGTENATGQGLDRHVAIGVELGGVVGGAVGLQTVDGGDNGDLDGMSGGTTEGNRV